MKIFSIIIKRVALCWVMIVLFAKAEKYVQPGEPLSFPTPSEFSVSTELYQHNTVLEKGRLRSALAKAKTEQPMELDAYEDVFGEGDVKLFAVNLVVNIVELEIGFTLILVPQYKQRKTPINPLQV